MFFRVTALEPLHDEPAQQGRRRGTVRGREAGELRCAEGEGERAPVGQFAAAREQLGPRGKELLHFGWRTEMIFAVQTLFRMWLPQESQRANALHHVVLPAVRRLFIVDRKRSDARQRSRALVEGVEAGDFQVKAVGEERGRFGDGADSEQPVGGKSEGRRPRAEGRPKAESRRSTLWAGQTLNLEP